MSVESTKLVIDLWLLPITAGIVLAAASGLRAFLPLAAVAWAAYLGGLELHHSFAWIGTVPSVLLFTAAVVFEVVGDKVPAVDHFLDGIQVFLKPVAGALVIAAPLVELDPLYVFVIVMVTGGAIAEGVHLVKAKGRIVGNLMTFGMAAPVLSFMEDAATILLVSLAVLVPLAALMLAGFLIAGLLVIRRRRARVDACPPV